MIEDNAHGLFGAGKAKPLGESRPDVHTRASTKPRTSSAAREERWCSTIPTTWNAPGCSTTKAPTDVRSCSARWTSTSWKDTGSSFGLSDTLAAYLTAQLEQRETIQGKRASGFDQYVQALTPVAAEHRTRVCPSCLRDAIRPSTCSTFCCPTSARRDAVLTSMRAEGISSDVPLRTTAQLRSRATICGHADRVPDHHRYQRQADALARSTTTSRPSRSIGSSTRSARALVAHAEVVMKLVGNRRSRLHRQPLRPLACSPMPGGSAPTERDVVLDKLTYAGNIANLAPVIGRRPAALRRGRHPRPRARRPADGGVRRGRPLRRRESRRPLDPRRRRLRDDQRRRHPDPARRGAARTASTSSCTSRPTRSTARSSRAAGTRSEPLEPNSPYSASKAASDLLARSYFRTHRLPVCVTRCSNNYGPYQFPEKVIPLFVTNLIDGAHGAAVRRGRQHPRLAARRRPLPRHPPGAGRRARRRGLQHRRRHRADQPGAHRPAARGVRRRLGPSVEHVEDRKGHDLRYSVDIDKIQNELGYRPRKSTSSRAGRHHRVVRRQPRPGGSRSRSAPGSAPESSLLLRLSSAACLAPHSPVRPAFEQAEQVLAVAALEHPLARARQARRR